MANREMDELWHKFKRAQVKPATLEFQKFTINGKPTCMAWYGLGSHARMACQFIGTSHFGSKLHCLYTGNEIYPEEDGGLVPVTGCPLWKD